MAIGKRYYELLPEDIQVKFKTNLIKDAGKPSAFRKYLDRKFDGFEDFIDSAFHWSKTPEGDVYWRDLSYSKEYEIPKRKK